MYFELKDNGSVEQLRRMSLLDFYALWQVNEEHKERLAEQYKIKP